jgi:hypothetical protein
MLLAKPSYALGLGAAVAALALVWLVATGPDDVVGLVAFVARFVHIGAAMLWVGMIWFVNFVQLVVLQEVGELEREVLLARIVPRVMALLTAASHVVLASGAVLLLSTGYLLDRWVFPSAVYIPTARAVMLWSGAAGGLAMWWLVRAVIRPGVRTILDGGAPAAAARERVLVAARINLALAVPVTFAMIAAAHLV